MNGGVVAIVIVAIVASMIVRLVKIHHGMEPEGGRRRDRGRAAADPALPSPREQELQREVEDLRERIHVLERIATDGRKPQALADEIERLRDK